MDALDRLYRRVFLTLARDPARALSIGDLYQEVVPYRLIRAELGFAELAEYEHALLRLLSGEREYLELDRPEVADEFRRELQAPNPILGIYRDYADVGVAPNPFAPTLDATAPPPVVVAGPSPAAAPSLPRVDLPPPGERTDPGASVTAEPPPPPKPRPKPCPGCRSPLPTDREARFCPFCGKPLVPVPCADCSAMLEPEWTYCATCGSPRLTGGTGPAPRPEQRLR